MGTLKAALTAIFNAHGDNDFGSTSKVPYFDSSNNPYGMATPAKLASVLGGVYLSFSSGMSTATTTASTPYNLFEIEDINGTVLFLFSYVGRRGIYAANKDKITEIAPSRALGVNQEEGSHKLYVDEPSRKVYFTSVNSQNISWKVIQVL